VTNIQQKIIFLTLVRIDNIQEHGLYQDLLRSFVMNDHEVTIVCPLERKYKQSTRVIKEENVTILQVKTLNIQKCNLIEKGLSTITINALYKNAIKKHINNLEFDIILYVTPPITFTNLILWLKAKTNARTYLLLKDIFPQNAVDMGMISKKSFIHSYFKKKEIDLYKLSDKVGCMSPANKDYLLKHHPELEGKVEINPNSIEIRSSYEDNFSREIIREKYNIPGNAVVFIYGGNLGKPQGTEFLLPLIKEFQELNPNAYFLIVGDGTDFQKINTWFLNEKPYNAKLIRSLPREEYNALVQVSDVGLILLRKEFTIPNFPSRLLTYLEYKKPVLCFTDEATDIGKIAKENNFGDWTVHGNFKTSKEKVLEFSLDNENREKMGNSGFSFLIKEYDVQLSGIKILQQNKF
jgi:glycosyltransferase involved in cell wall biosynthesis